MFITFEGPEGGGKTTQMALLAETLRGWGGEVVTTREPGGAPAAEQVRELVLHGQLFPETEALLFLAARAEHVRAIVRPALDRGATVLCDRFNDSTLAYQGYGLGMDVERLRALCEFATGGLCPHLTLLLDLPPETGFRRRLGLPGQLRMEIDLPQSKSPAEGINKMENRNLEYHHRVREGFLKEAEREPSRIYRIDASRPVKQVRQVIEREVLRRLRLDGRQEGAA